MQRKFDDAVNEERDRRLFIGIDVNVTGYGWVALQGRQQDITHLTSLLTRATSMIAAGDLTSTLFLIGRDNVNHHMTALQMLELLQVGQAYVDAIYQAGSEIKALDGPHGDPATNSRWPVATFQP